MEDGGWLLKVRITNQTKDACRAKMQGFIVRNHGNKKRALQNIIGWEIANLAQRNHSNVRAKTGFNGEQLSAIITKTIIRNLKQNQQ